MAANQFDAPYGITVKELKELMELKGLEFKQKLDDDFGGMQELGNRLQTDLKTGLTGFDLEKRIKSFGKNEIPPKPPKSIFRLAFEALQDTTLIMLMVCAVISIGLSFYHPPPDNSDETIRLATAETMSLEWVEGVAIAIAVIVVVSVSSFNDWRKERQFRGLQDRIAADNMANVIRNGQNIQVNVKDLVVGDVCCIKYGDLIPADGAIIQASDLKIDEASLTGETDLIKKNEDNPVIFSGTHVMEGSGQFLVTAVGLNSQNGIIMTLLGATAEKDDDEDDEDDKKDNKKKKPLSAKSKVSPENSVKGDEVIKEQPTSAKRKLPPKKKEKKHKSVLQTKLAKLAIQIGYVGLCSAAFTFIMLILRLVIEEFGIKKNTWSNKYVKYILSYLINAITVIVVGVPEGLPLAVTLALAFAVKKMTKDNNLVRHIDACETMGNATTICSDKTGTLTTNRMTAVQCWISDSFFEKIPPPSEINPKIRDLIYQSISVNSNYTSNIQVTSTPGELPKQIGNKTECGLLGFVNDLGGNYENVRKDFPNDRFLKVFTFNSARKMMSTSIRTKDSKVRLHSKGASEMVLGKCTSYLDKNGNVVSLNQSKIDDMIKNVVEKMAMNGLRTICVAYRDFGGSEPNWEDEENILCNLTCICLVGIEDPVRPEVPAAVASCQSSGVVVRMVTGDNINTATSIAMKCGIIKPGDDFLILESKEFNKRIRDANGEVQQELLDKVWPKLRVLARSSPTDKYILVNGIVLSKATDNQEVVAVTGDGTNDGPALKRADVGFAMGIQGTDVAKEAADIILTDDNFSSIVKAMMWGRNVYDAIAKFLQFQLTANITAGFFSVICAAAIQTVPLKAVQMLWVNLVMDTLASLALATEPPTESLLKRKPYGRTKPMVSITMWKCMIGQAIYQLSILFGLIYGIEAWMNVDSVIKYNDYNRLSTPSVHFSVVFNVFVLMTLFNEFNGRKIHSERNVFEGIQNNPTFIIIWLICLSGQILIVNVGGIVFSVERIDWDHWMWSIFLGAGGLLWNQLIICIPDSFVEKVFSIIFTPCNRMKKKTDSDSDKQIELKVNDPVLTEKIKDSDEKKLQTRKKPSKKCKQLWLNAVNKIQTQLLTVKKFKNYRD